MVRLYADPGMMYFMEYNTAHTKDGRAIDYTHWETDEALRTDMPLVYEGDDDIRIEYGPVTLLEIEEQQRGYY